MAFSIKIVTKITEDSNDEETVATRTFTSLTKRYDREEVVNNAAAILWDSSAEGAVADFDVLVLQTDVAVEVEFTCKDGDANEELAHLPLAANTCFTLGADDARYNHSASDAFAGTLDVLDRIRVKEVNSVDATVRLRLFT